MKEVKDKLNCKCKNLITLATTLALLILITPPVYTTIIKTQSNGTGTVPMIELTNVTIEPTYATPLIISTQQPNSSLYYQQLLNINTTMFRGYVSSNLSNILFTYSNGTPIFAWIQNYASNSSTIVHIWIYLHGLVNRTVFLLFFPKKDVLFNQEGYLGESAQLSAHYGKYDNGNLVFPPINHVKSYFNFSSVDDFCLYTNEQSNSIYNEFYINNGLQINTSKNQTNLYFNFYNNSDLNLSVNAHIIHASTNYLLGWNGLAPNDYSTVGINKNGTTDILNTDTNRTMPFFNGFAQVGGLFTVYDMFVRHIYAMPRVSIYSCPMPINKFGLYIITFKLPNLSINNLEWSISVPHSWNISTKSRSIAIVLSNGTYHYEFYDLNAEYVPTLENSSFRVSGTNLTISLNFSRTYAVSFNQNEIQPGWLWKVTINNKSSYFSYNKTVNIRLVNGTYEYVIQSIGISRPDINGIITISGKNENVTVMFSLTNTVTLNTEYFLAISISAIFLFFMLYLNRKLRR